ADPEQRGAEVEQPLDEHVLLAQPRMPIVLVGVHRAAEDEHCPVLVHRAGRRRSPGEAPLVEDVPALRRDVGEDAGADFLAGDDREGVHAPPLLTGPAAPASRLWSCNALKAACATRPPLPSGLDALLLKNAKAESALPASSRSGSTHSASSSSG